MRFPSKSFAEKTGPVRLILGAIVCFGSIAASQQPQTASQEGVQQDRDRSMTAAQRAAATRKFLGLGAVPDSAAAARGEPLFKQNCGFCHGQNAHGATGPSLITSDMVLADDHGEHLVPFLKKGRSDKGMPGFATMTDRELIDVAEFLHQQVEDVANRGSYHVLNILVGNSEKGKTYVQDHCLSCHTVESFAHISTRFHSPEQLQRNWIWPASAANVTASVTASGQTVAGRVTQISDFRITLIDNLGKTHTFDRGPEVEVRFSDPLLAHRQIVMSLANDDMHDVTAYLETLK